MESILPDIGPDKHRPGTKRWYHQGLDIEPPVTATLSTPQIDNIHTAGKEIFPVLYDSETGNIILPDSIVLGEEN